MNILVIKAELKEIDPNKVGQIVIATLNNGDKYNKVFKGVTAYSRGRTFMKKLFTSEAQTQIEKMSKQLG